MAENIQNLYNPDKHMNYNELLNSIIGKSFEDIIKVFKKRIYRWYIYFGDKLFFESHASFMLMVVSIMIIDLLNQYECNLISSSGNEFINFLKTKLPDFNQQFRNQIPYKTFHLKKSRFKLQTKYDYAQVFWESFRNGIVHNAMIRPHGRISSRNQIVQDEIWSHIDTSSNTINQVELAIDPHKFYLKVRDLFYDYLKRLKDPNEIILRTNFKDKFYRDFGIRIP
ncbi:MAG: hypothetical protein ACTSVV_19490 [Promethearchaeota archaeon]